MWGYTYKECHKTGSRWNHITTDHKEAEQLEDRRNVGENGCNSEDGTDQTGPILYVYDDDDNIFKSPDIVTVIKVRRLEWLGHCKNSW